MTEAVNAKLELLEIELETVRLFARRSPHGSAHQTAARERETELLGEVARIRGLETETIESPLSAHNPISE